MKKNREDEIVEYLRELCIWKFKSSTPEHMSYKTCPICDGHNLQRIRGEHPILPNWFGSNGMRMYTVQCLDCGGYVGEEKFKYYRALANKGGNK